MERVIKTNKLKIDGNGCLVLSSGTSSQRPSEPENGSLRFNTETTNLEFFRNGWYNLYDTGANNRETSNVGNITGSYDFEFNDSSIFKLTLTGNCSFTFSPTGLTSNTYVTLVIALIQDNFGNKLVNWPESIKWNGGYPPTLSTIADSLDIVQLVSFDGGTTFYGTIAMQISP